MAHWDEPDREKERDSRELGYTEAYELISVEEMVRIIDVGSVF